MWCTQLTGNAGPKKSPKALHLRIIAQLCRAISSQLRHISTIGKKNLPHRSSQYGELRPTSSWDPLASLGHPCNFQRVSHLGSVTARHSSSGRQPNFAALNRGRHVYLAGRPSCWALAHISSLECFSGWCHIQQSWHSRGESQRAHKLPYSAIFRCGGTDTL